MIELPEEPEADTTDQKAPETKPEELPECKGDFSMIELPEEPEADATDEKAPETKLEEFPECKAGFSLLELPEEPNDPNHDEILVAPGQEAVTTKQLHHKLFKHVQEFYMPTLETEKFGQESEEEAK